MCSHFVQKENYSIWLQEQPLDVNSAYSFLINENCGATSLFVGSTRKTELGSHGPVGDQVVSLEYSCYPEMAIKLMVEMAERELISNPSVHRCYIVHRLGLVRVTEPSIIIGCSSESRVHCHQLVLHMLNQIKSSVPIWKKVNYLNSFGQWSQKSEAFWLQRDSSNPST